MTKEDLHRSLQVSSFTRATFARTTTDLFGNSVWDAMKMFLNSTLPKTYSSWIPEPLRADYLGNTYIYIYIYMYTYLHMYIKATTIANIVLKYV